MSQLRVVKELNSVFLHCSNKILNSIVNINNCNYGACKLCLDVISCFLMLSTVRIHSDSCLHQQKQMHICLIFALGSVSRPTWLFLWWMPAEESLRRASRRGVRPESMLCWCVRWASLSWLWLSTRWTRSGPMHITAADTKKNNRQQQKNDSQQMAKWFFTWIHMNFKSMWAYT